MSISLHEINAAEQIIHALCAGERDPDRRRDFARALHLLAVHRSALAIQHQDLIGKPALRLVTRQHGET